MITDKQKERIAKKDAIQLTIDFKLACNVGNLELVEYACINDVFTMVDACKKDKESANICFLEAVKNGHFDVVKYLLNNAALAIDINYEKSEAFSLACESGNLDIVKYLLTSPDLNTHIDIEKFGQTGLELACMENHAHIVEYLLLSSDLKNHPDIRNEKEYSFIYAAEAGALRVIDFVLNSKEINYIPSDVAFTISCKKAAARDQLKTLEVLLDYQPKQSMKTYWQLIRDVLRESASENKLETIKFLLESKKFNTEIIVEDLHNILINASFNNHVEVVKYILMDCLFKDNINIHKEDNLIFKSAIRIPATGFTNPNDNAERIKLMNFLVLDYNMEITPAIKEILEKHKDDVEIYSLFEKKELKESLEKDLAKNNQVKKLKI